MSKQSAAGWRIGELWCLHKLAGEGACCHMLGSAHPCAKYRFLHGLCNTLATRPLRSIAMLFFTFTGVVWYIEDLQFVILEFLQRTPIMPFCKALCWQPHVTQLRLSPRAPPEALRCVSYYPNLQLLMLECTAISAKEVCCWKQGAKAPARQTGHLSCLMPERGG